MDICVFGDSIAKGVIFDEKKNKYVFSKRGFLDLIAMDTGVTFRNYSRFGCTVMKGSELIDRHLDELSEYDHVLLEFGGNDCDLNWKAASDDPGTPQTGQTAPEDFIKCYAGMIRKIKAHGGDPILMSLPPLEPYKFFDWVSKDLDRFSVMEFLQNDKTNIYRWQAEYSDMIFEVGNMTDTPVLDIRRPFLESPSYEDMICIDGMHPNEAGHKAIAGFIEDEWLSLAGKGSNIIKWEDMLPFQYSFAGAGDMIFA